MRPVVVRTDALAAPWRVKLGNAKLTPEDALELARALQAAAYEAVDHTRAESPDEYTCPYCGLDSH